MSPNADEQAATTRCDLVLADIPFYGLQVAAERAAADQLSGTSLVVLADGAALPPQHLG